MKKITSAKFVPGTMNPAVGSEVRVEFDDNTSTIVRQDTLLKLYDTDLESVLIGQEWKGE